MVAAVAGGWIAFGVTASAVLAFSIGFTRLYTDKHDSEKFTSVVTMLGLFVVLSIVTLVPVDIFMVSSTMDTKTGLRAEWATESAVSDLLFALEVTYYVAYSVIMFFVFALIPFAYFYFEEFDEGVSTKKRILGALKYTIFTIFLLLVIWLLGVFIKPGDLDPTDPEWLQDLFNANGAIRAVCFVIAVMTIIGLFIFIMYTAFGLFALPIGMLKRNNIGKEAMEVSSDLEATRSKKNTLESKYLGGKKVSSKDRKTLDDLERKERLLSKRSNILDQESKSWQRRCYSCLVPFKFVFGVVFLLLSLFLFVSLLLTAIDKAANSLCGAGCGFVVENPKIFNPVDSLFVVLSRAFPVDYIILVVIIAYFFLCTIAGIMKIGVRFLWVHLYRIRIRATVPQGLLLLCGLLMLALLALNMYVLTLAPVYSSFGYQKYCNATIIPGEESPCLEDSSLLVACNLEAPENTCTPSMISTIFTRIQVMQPFFGIVFFAGEWAFLAATFVGFFVAIFKKSARIELTDSDDEDE